jgi:uncharacterized small protein (DUF1192 family)
VSIADYRPHMPSLRSLSNEYGVVGEAVEYIDALEAEVERYRADTLAVAKALGTVYEPDMGPVYPGTVTDMLQAIRSLEAEVERLTDHLRSRGEHIEYLRADGKKLEAEVERLRAELADARSGLQYTHQYRVLPLPTEGGE